VQDELLTIGNKILEFDEISNRSDCISDTNDNHKTLDNNDPQQFIEYINIESLHTYRKRVIFLNTGGLRNDKKSSEYINIFDKDVNCLVAHSRLSTDKLESIKDIAKK